MNHSILVVDDEESIIKLIKDYFELQGFLVYTANSGTKALEAVVKQPDLILLDINMPDMDGFEVCKRIRDSVHCPIVFLTAKVLEQDRIKGLMIGGDDYILKPFSLDELSARVTAHLRRETRGVQKDKVCFCKDLIVNYTSRSVQYNEHIIKLTKTEFDILEYLSLHKGQALSKEHIYEALWGYEGDGDSSIITEHVRRIRMKIARYTEEACIDTVWGVGYKWIG